MFWPTAISASSLLVARMCGEDSTLTLDDLASAWNSTAYDGMLVPNSSCDCASAGPTRPLMRPVAVAMLVRSSDFRSLPWTPPNRMPSLSLPTGAPPWKLVPRSRPSPMLSSRITASMKT